MQIRSTKRKSTFHQISENPDADIVIGSNTVLPQNLVAGAIESTGNDLRFYKLNPDALLHQEKLVGTQIKFLDLSLSTMEQGLLISKFDLSNGTNTFFTTTGVVLSCAETYHSLTKENPDALEIAISTTKTIAAVADLAAPFVPFLRNYQPHIKYVTLLLKTVGAGKEVLELTYTPKELNRQ